jgi:predicted dehydrogenase
MGSQAYTPVSIAIIGAGTIGRKHASLVSGSRDANLMAIVDPTTAGTELAQQYGSTLFSNLTSLLEAKEKPDAAIICTPNETHVPIAKKLAEAGIHLLIEKPISTSVEEGQPLLDFCRSRGARICVGHHRRFHSSIIAARSALESGTIGNVMGVSGVWASLKTESYFQESGRWRTGTNGGVVLINLIHDLDLIQNLVGPIVRVFAERAPSTRGHTAEEGVAITLRFANGAVGTFLALDNSPSPFSMERGTSEFDAFPFTGKDCYRFFGRRGALTVPGNTVWTPKSLEQGWYSELTEEKLPYEKVGVFDKQLENFIGVVRGYEEPSCSGEAGLAAVAACEAVRKSLETGTPAGVLTNGKSGQRWVVLSISSSLLYNSQRTCLLLNQPRLFS